jgi:putative heme-binding domain-containing protein
MRVHALQLADRWFAHEEGYALLETSLATVARESNPRVLIQLALSLGQAQDSRAFAALAGLARTHLELRWMDAAILSGLAGRGTDMLSELLREPGGSGPLLAPLAEAIASRHDEIELARVLKLLAYAPPETQSTVLEGLAKGRKHAPRKPIADSLARATLDEFATNASPLVRKSARTLADTFVGTVSEDQPASSTGIVAAEQVSEKTFGSFVAALANPRDRERGHAVYVQACATCHRIGDEGHEVGPDLLGQLGVAEESLLHDILTPSQRIRPGYETTEVRTRNGSIVAGLLKEDSATSLRLVQAGGVEQVVLRKDVSEARRLSTSLMPAFGETLKPADVANLLAWLRTQFGPAADKKSQ